MPRPLWMSSLRDNYLVAVLHKRRSRYHSNITCDFENKYVNIRFVVIKNVSQKIRRPKTSVQAKS